MIRLLNSRHSFTSIINNCSSFIEREKIDKSAQSERMKRIFRQLIGRNERRNIIEIRLWIDEIIKRRISKLKGGILSYTHTICNEKYVE
jgi:hypothetical protein